MLRRSYVIIVLVSTAVRLSLASQSRAIVVGPSNDAFEPGPETTLVCEASSSQPSSRVSWTEYVTNVNGAPISDNEQILPGHPNAARYTIDYDGATTYNLTISPTVLGDGGIYRCIDINDSGTPRYAQIITIAGKPNCTSNIPADGYVREGQYYTMECSVFYQGKVAPVMTWSGPDGYASASTTTNTSVWSGFNINVTRYQSGYSFSLLTSFTEPGFIQENFASNVPTWKSVDSTPELYVQWEPKSLYIVPVKSSYEVGDEIQCHADANPSATFFWQNLDTNERWDDFRLYCDDRLVGSQRMRCNAANNITGTIYTADFFFNLTVNPRSTTPSPTTITTTTTAPAESSCDDLTGRWHASSPHVVDLCLEINNTNYGRVVGIMRNATDPYFIEIRGRVVPYQYNQIGLSGVWPVNIGTVSFVGTCKKCFGDEYLQINAIGRSTNDNIGCTDFGAIRYTPTYLFSRVGPPCRGLLF